MNILGAPTVKANTAANRILASPDGSSGDAVLRAMVDRDLPTSVRQGFITGLKLSWVSATTIGISGGSAHIENSGKVLSFFSSTRSPSLSANTWYYVYIYDNVGTPDLEISTTAPASSPYIGSAYSKNGDATKRYIGAFRTNGSSQIHNFLQIGTLVLWRVVTYVNFRVLNGGSSTTAANIDCSSAVPANCQVAFVRIIDGATTGVMLTDTSDSTGTGSGYNSLVALNAGAQAFAFHPLNSSRQMRYWFDVSPSGGSGYVDVYGFWFER